jgi:hypothetical protein
METRGKLWGSPILDFAPPFFAVDNTNRRDLAGLSRNSIDPLGPFGIFSQWSDCRTIFFKEQWNFWDGPHVVSNIVQKEDPS